MYFVKKVSQNYYQTTYKKINVNFVQIQNQKQTVYHLLFQFDPNKDNFTHCKKNILSYHRRQIFYVNVINYGKSQ